MYIHDLGPDWMAHPFLRSRFEIRNGRQIEKIAAAGIHEVYIDTSKGIDVTDAPTREEIAADVERDIQTAMAAEPAQGVERSFNEELVRAARIRDRAQLVVREVMQDVRLGRAVELEKVEPLVGSITESILCNSDALISLLRIKNKDDYTFLHSVSVCALMVSFGRSIGLERDAIQQGGIGGLLHDVGKMKVPDAILNKAGKLTDEEFAIMKAHPADGHAVLLEAGSVGATPLDITLHHHERMDGSGYPDRLPGENITMAARMAAIVDVYDAITSERCYHKGLAPADALRKMWEWSKFHFDQSLMRSFMRCIGIYPRGTLVRLESGRLAVVLAQSDGNLLAPKVKLVFSTKSNVYVVPEELDLSRPMGKGGADRIIGHEDPGKWQINVNQFL